MLFRRHRSPFATAQVCLREIARDAKYEVSLSYDYTPAPSRQMTGAELMAMTITIDSMPGSVLVRYRAVS